MTIIGIDLGTTKSVVAVWHEGKPVVIPDPAGPPGQNHIMPSVVAFDPRTKRWLVGHPALQLAQSEPERVILSSKRLMGRRYEDEFVQEQSQRRHLLYKLDRSHWVEDGIAAVVAGNELTPQEVAAKILGQLKRNAEVFLGYEVNQAVITVPAYFNDTQRQASQAAGRLAGLRVSQMLNEPTAACLAFGFSKRLEARKTIAVYDLGGGTFDVSILEVGGGLPFSVRATAGETFLGGDDLNWLIVEWLLKPLDPVIRKLIDDHPPSLASLRIEAEAAKKRLSTDERTQLVIGADHLPPSVPPFEYELSRETLEQLAAEWIEKTFVPCRLALRDAELTASDIQEVLLVGGQTRMPALRRAVQDFFGIEPTTTVDPEEVVGLGAAVLAAVLAGQLSGLKLADVVPLSLGVDALGEMDVLIQRNTRVPVRVTKMYTTVSDNQPAVEIQIYQGEEVKAHKNVRLATLRLEVEPAPKGQPHIEVIFNVDMDGILNVTAIDKATGNEKQVTPLYHPGLSESQLREIRETEQAQDDEAHP